MLKGNACNVPARDGRIPKVDFEETRLCLDSPAFGAALSLAPHPRSRDWKLSAPFATGYATVNKISNIVNHRVLA